MRGHGADEQNHLVTARREKIGQLRAEAAGRKIREPPHVVQRFVSRSGGDDAVHAAMIADGGWRMEARIAPVNSRRRRREESQTSRQIAIHFLVRDSSPRLLRQKNHVGIEPGVAAARQSAANRTGVFQMAAFSRKPLRRAKLFHLFDNEHFDWLAARQINYSGPTYVVSVRTRPSSVIMPKTIALPPGL